MLVRHRTSVVVALAVLLLFAACVEDTQTEPAATATPARSAGHADQPASVETAEPAPTLGASGLPLTVEEGTAWGIAGLVPPRFPDATEEDWRTLYRALPELGGWVGTFASWSPEGGMPDIMRSQAAVGGAFDFHTVPNVGFSRQDIGEYGLTVDFTDPDQVEVYSEALAALARDVRPSFLGVGNEINLLWEDDPAAFDAFATALPGIADRVREASPRTRVFTTFQLEFLRGGGAISGVEREPRWDLVDAVADAIDFVAFTTYPWFDYPTPEEIPGDYYRAILDELELPIGFTELGWPAGELAVAPGGLGAGTPEAQAAFIERLEELLEGIEPVLGLWVHAFDSPAAGELFATLGLHEADGTPRTSVEAWQRLIGRG
jgi:hypothetical protein